MMEVYSAVRLVAICVLATLPTADGFVLHGALAKHAAAPRSLTIELNFFNELKRGIDKLQAVGVGRMEHCPRRHFPATLTARCSQPPPGLIRRGRREGRG